MEIKSTFYNVATNKIEKGRLGEYPGLCLRVSVGSLAYCWPSVLETPYCLKSLLEEVVLSVLSYTERWDYWSDWLSMHTSCPKVYFTIMCIM